MNVEGRYRALKVLKSCFWDVAFPIHLFRHLCRRRYRIVWPRYTASKDGRIDRQTDRQTDGQTTLSFQ